MKYISKRYLDEKYDIIKRSMNIINQWCEADDEVTEEVYLKVKNDLIYACKAIVTEFGDPAEE